MNDDDQAEIRSFIQLHARSDDLNDLVRSSLDLNVLSDLARLIEKFLSIHRYLEARDLFQSIADLNQGTLDDLARPDFISYLCAHSSVSISEIAYIRQSLRSFVTSPNDAGEIRMAARGLGHEPLTSPTEIEAILVRRVS